MEFANILNPFNIGPLLFSVNIYSYLFPIKFLLMSIGFVILLGICLEKFEGKNPYGKKLSEGSIVFICIAIAVVLLFFYFIMRNSSDLERDAIGSEYKTNYYNKEQSEWKIKKLKGLKGDDHASVRKEKRKLEQYEKNINNIPIVGDHKKQMELDADREKLVSLENEISKFNLELENEGLKFFELKNKDIDNLNEKFEGKIQSLKDSWEDNLAQINDLEQKDNVTGTKRHDGLAKLKDLRFKETLKEDPYFNKQDFKNKLQSRINKIDIEIAKSNINPVTKKILEKEKDYLKRKEDQILFNDQFILNNP